MKTEILKVVVDSFVDYANIEHKFVVVAAVRRVDGLKHFGIGFSICNPSDEFNEELGVKIATNKAFDNNNKLLAWVSCNAFITPLMVDTLIAQEIEYFKNSPASHIAGYNTLKDKFIKAKNVNLEMQAVINVCGNALQDLEKLTPEQKKIVIKFLNEG